MLIKNICTLLFSHSVFLAILVSPIPIQENIKAFGNYSYSPRSLLSLFLSIFSSDDDSPSFYPSSSSSESLNTLSSHSSILKLTLINFLIFLSITTLYYVTLPILIELILSDDVSDISSKHNG